MLLIQFTKRVLCFVSHSCFLCLAAHVNLASWERLCGAEETTRICLVIFICQYMAVTAFRIKFQLLVSACPCPGCPCLPYVLVFQAIINCQLSHFDVDGLHLVLMRFAYGTTKLNLLCMCLRWLKGENCFLFLLSWCIEPKGFCTLYVFVLSLGSGHCKLCAPYLHCFCDQATFNWTMACDDVMWCYDGTTNFGDLWSHVNVMTLL